MTKLFTPQLFRGARVLVVGDAMLDKFVYGAVERISPEAPIPVLRSTTVRCMPGGAANVASNAAALGASTQLIGIANRDPDGLMLRELLLGQQLNLKFSLFADQARPTTVKTRFVSGAQQILRVDLEDTSPVSNAIQSAVCRDFSIRLLDADVVVISDYAKGLLTDALIAELLSVARKAGRPVFVDPKRSDFGAYRGATMIKPNIGELQRATNILCDCDMRVEEAAKTVLETTGAESLVVTSPTGMSLFGRNLPPQHLKTEAREVFDVSGAGDSAIATFAVAFAAGCNSFEAMRLANRAAGLAVVKLGTAVVTAQELAESLEPRPRPTPANQIVSLESALAITSAWRSQGLSIGFTNGCFDILHAGHVALLNKAATECDRLIVGLNSDLSVKKLKGPNRPAQDQVCRAEVLASLHMVDLLIIFDADTPIKLITTLRPDVLVKGGDYAIDRIVGADIVTAYGGRVVLADLVSGYSTTNTLERVKTLTD